MLLQCLPHAQSSLQAAQGSEDQDGEELGGQAKNQISGKYQKEEQVVASQEKRTHYNEKRAPPPF